mmetsp:Transcript_55384/g.134503  ORF Transcript_55384/g.134503 Transcript_55384/m.134503 type:complete len:220 (+) Transcript_55384:370-1029(+)
MLAISSDDKARTFLAGDPAHNSPLGTFVPGVTTAAGAMIEFVSTDAPSIICADSPTTTRSPIVHAWTIAPAPIVTLFPMFVGESPWIFATCTTARSPTLDFDPIVTLFTSPLTVAPYQTLECSPIVTFPITDADGAMKLFAPGNAGATPSTETIRLDGTSFSVYLANSILAPIPSRAAPTVLAAPEAATAILLAMDDIVRSKQKSCLVEMKDRLELAKQ